jgi:DHA2 family multidrug resistance protein-like MFS transporter
VLLEHFWWGSVFLPAVPVMGLLLAVGPRLLPEYRDPEAGRLDLASAALSLVAVLAVIYGLKQIAQNGLSGEAALSIAAGLAVGATFVRRQMRLTDPLIDLSLFRAPAFDAALAINTFGFFVNFGIAVFLAQYLQLVIGLSPFEAGLWTVPYAVGFIVGAMLTPVFLRWIRPALVIAGGLVVAGAGFAMLTQVDGESALATLVAGSVVLALGLAPVYTLAADLMVGAAPPERAGGAAGISETSAELGGALGIAVLGAVGTAVYRGQIDDAALAGAPPEAAEAAQDTLGAAVAAGDDLPGQVAPGLVDAAQEAFTQALQVAATLSALIVIGTAILAVLLLQRVRIGSELDEAEDLEPDRALAAGGRPC